MADSKRYALALNMYGKEWGKVKGSVEWENNEEERKQVHKVPESKPWELQVSSMDLDRTKLID